MKGRVLDRRGGASVSFIIGRKIPPEGIPQADPPAHTGGRRGHPQAKPAGSGV